jgi:hypothetical protein
MKKALKTRVLPDPRKWSRSTSPLRPIFLSTLPSRVLSLAHRLPTRRQLLPLLSLVFPCTVRPDPTTPSRLQLHGCCHRQLRACFMWPCVGATWSV